MTPVDIMIAFTLFAVKHFIVDFVLQKPYQYLNKGKYGHPGGILHSGLHGVATFPIVLMFVSIPTAAIVALADAVVHYHIDWAKIQTNTVLELTPTNSEYYWWLLGLDQLLHQLTYIAILVYIM